MQYNTAVDVRQYSRLHYRFTAQYTLVLKGVQKSLHSSVNTVQLMTLIIFKIDEQGYCMSRLNFHCLPGPLFAFPEQWRVNEPTA